MSTRTRAIFWMAVSLFIASPLPALAAAISIDTISLKVNGVARDIGKIDATLNGNSMTAEFTLDENYVGLEDCCDFWWLQVVTELVEAESNPDYNGEDLEIPIIDTPNGGYDGQAGEDDQPWYLTPTDISNNNLNGTNGDGSLFYKTLDTPSVVGAAFDTWIVALLDDMEFCVIAGFEWGSGTLGGANTLQKKNGDGVPSAANITTITNALTNGGFNGWTPTRNCDIECTIPEPAAWQLVIAAAASWGCRRRRVCMPS